jgi:hypothetical protein
MRRAASRFASNAAYVAKEQIDPCMKIYISAMPEFAMPILLLL